MLSISYALLYSDYLLTPNFYRSHPLMMQIREATNLGLEIINIKVTNLDCSNVKSLVAEVLNMEDREDKVDSLATIIYNKTDGTAFYVLAFLRSLYDEELLQYNVGLMAWKWDETVITQKLVTQNVASIMINKMKRFTEELQNMLKVASVLGASSNISLLEVVVNNLDLNFGEEDLDASLRVSHVVNELENEGLWERDNNTIRFAHDQIQLSAFQLIPEEERDSFMGRIGNIFMTCLEPQEMRHAIFEVVSLCNCASLPKSQEDRKKLATLNLQAGLKACTNGAYSLAVVYFEQGRRLLGDKAWDIDRDIMLQLCSNEANSRFVIGDNKLMEKLVDEVLDRNDIDIKQKFIAYEVKIMSSIVKFDYDMAINTAMHVRRDLGLPAPANKSYSKLTVAKELMKTNRLLKRYTAEDIAALPKLSDERIILGLRVLDLIYVAVFLYQPSMYPIIILLSTQTTIQYGISASGVVGLASYCVLLW